MNSLRRQLPYHCSWWCHYSVPATSARQLTWRMLPLCHRSSWLHVLASMQNFKPNNGCTSNSNRHFATCLQDSFSLLGVATNCTDQELKDAYLEKAKAYHPDSAAATANAHKFSQVRDAYKAVLEQRKGRELKEEEEKEVEIVFDIKHTAPQHRQYLEFEGVGFGTPSQRQRQYQQHQVARVTENVFQYRIQQLASETEDALVVKDKQQAKKAVISNAMERIVEDLIQESMKRGDFDNLPGQGQPLTYSPHNPFVDATTHNVNKVLANNGFAPEWIMLQSEIRKDIQQAREVLAVTHSRLQEPYSATDAKTWRAALDKFKQQISDINIKINKFNLIVPILHKQKMIFNIEREMKRVLDNVQDYVPKDSDAHLVWDVALTETSSFDFRQVWQDIKDVFRASKHKHI